MTFHEWGFILETMTILYTYARLQVPSPTSVNIGVFSHMLHHGEYLDVLKLNMEYIMLVKTMGKTIPG